MLGTVNGGVVEVTNSFGVYHKTTQDEVSVHLFCLGLLFAFPLPLTAPPRARAFPILSARLVQILIRRQTLYDMLELHRRVDPKETLVGWYSTWKEDKTSASSHLEERGSSSGSSSNSNSSGAAGSGGAGAAEHIDQFSLVVQDFFAEAAPGKVPFHLLVDVSLRTPTLKILAYKPVHNNIIKNVIVQFARLRVQVVASTEERVALDTMARSARLTDPPSGSAHVPPTGEARDVAPDLAGLESSLVRLRKLLDTVSAYVDDVVAGKREGDEALGRQIADAISSIPSLGPDRIGAALSGSINDTLMVTYLAQLAAVHLKIAERVAQLPTF